jgi:cysteine desulfurase
MKPIYLDHAATTPVREEVAQAMASCLAESFGNPSSIHRWGRMAAAALDEARDTCAQAIGSKASEIYFVRGGTESDNMAVMGRVARLRSDGHKPTVVVSEVEHKAVLDAARQATARGLGRMVTLAVGPDGSLDRDALDAALADAAPVVSVMWVNNETGTMLPVHEIAHRAGAAGATFQADAVQAVGKIPVRVDQVPVDLLTLTGHKIYGPRGCGLLYVRSGTHLSPLLHGGGQERGLRPGTEDVAGSVGLATALRLAVEEQEAEALRLARLRDALEAGITSRVDGVRVNGGEGRRAPHVSSLAIPDVDGQALLMALDMAGIAISGGSACDSGAAKGSHVIAALYGDADPYATVRFSMGRATTEDHARSALEATVTVIEGLRAGIAGP